MTTVETRQQQSLQPTGAIQAIYNPGGVFGSLSDIGSDSVVSQDEARNWNQEAIVLRPYTAMPNVQLLTMFSSFDHESGQPSSDDVVAKLGGDISDRYGWKAINTCITRTQQDESVHNTREEWATDFRGYTQRFLKQHPTAEPIFQALGIDSTNIESEQFSTLLGTQTEDGHTKGIVDNAQEFVTAISKLNLDEEQMKMVIQLAKTLYGANAGEIITQITYLEFRHTQAIEGKTDDEETSARASFAQGFINATGNPTEEETTLLQWFQNALKKAQDSSAGEVTNSQDDHGPPVLLSGGQVDQKQTDSLLSKEVQEIPGQVITDRTLQKENAVEVHGHAHNYPSQDYARVFMGDGYELAIAFDGVSTIREVNLKGEEIDSHLARKEEIESQRRLMEEGAKKLNDLIAKGTDLRKALAEVADFFGAKCGGSLLHTGSIALKRGNEVKVFNIEDANTAHISAGSATWTQAITLGNIVKNPFGTEGAKHGIRFRKVPEHTIQLGEGDRILVCTDGLFNLFRNELPVLHSILQKLGSENLTAEAFKMKLQEVVLKKKHALLQQGVPSADIDDVCFAIL